MAADAYTFLASWFEYLNADCDYEQWSQYLYEKLRAAGVESGAGLDIGCGSGAFTRAFARRGFSMTGYDVSAPMLSKAEELGAREGVYPRYILSDMRRVKVLGPRADFALCVNDCLNYLPPAEVPAFFRRVAGCLRRGGAFLFDVSTPQKLRAIGGNTFCEERDELAYLWFNTLFADRVEMDITLFVREEDGKYRRGEEHHTQYMHEQAFLCGAAEEAGFTVLESGCIPCGGKLGSRIGFTCVRGRSGGNK